MAPSASLLLVLIFSQNYGFAPPVFTEPADISISDPTVAIYTHCSAHFDPLHLTKQAVDRTVSVTRHLEIPRLYFHDRYNTANRHTDYLYSDRNPAAYVSSDIGHYDIDSSHIRHVVSLGGFFCLCQKNTVSDAVRLWRRDAPGQNFRITLVLDGIFDVTESVRDSDPYADRVRTYLTGTLRTAHPMAAISVAKIVELIDDQELAIDFLSRQLPLFPANVHVRIDYFGHITTVRDATAVEAESADDGVSIVPTLTFAYRHSDNLYVAPHQDSTELR